MIALLRSLIATPSLSRREHATASIIEQWLAAHGAVPRRTGNNVWALSRPYNPGLPTLMLNSHHDTVGPAESYTIDPYTPLEADGKIYGLGSNDAGASVVSLCSTFAGLLGETLPFNLLLAISAEEEVGGEGGMRALLPALEAEGIRIDAAIVGEPTGMQPAVGERGLVVLDCTTTGEAGHAARAEGINAIYRAMADIDALRQYRFPAESSMLGPVTLNITQIEAGSRHNVIPDTCRWVVDVRATDAFSNEATAAMLQAAVSPYTKAVPRSTRVRASAISPSHPLVRAAAALGGEPFVSPTTSDMSLMPFASVKIGPGDSSRSHRADEYIRIDELAAAPAFYTKMILTLGHTGIL